MYACPKCHHLLSEDTASEAPTLNCPNCHIQWRQHDSVYSFCDDVYWGELPEEDMRRYLKEIASDGIASATRTVVLKHGADAARFFFDHSRGDWRFGMDIHATDRVLDVGCGMGGNTFALCDHVQEVVAFDLSWMRAKFVQLRAKEEGKTNVHVFCGDFITLPLPEREQFDIIVFNGILEWIGQSTIFADPYEVQQWVLKKCYTLLKPGGRLYIGIENRWAFSYLAGSPDHIGLRWTSWMPRFFARPYTQYRLGKDYRTYTHGKRGYTKLLKDAGFTDISIMMPYPGYNDQRILIPFENTTCLQYTIEHLMSNLSWKKKLVKLLASVPGVLSVYRYFFFSYNLYAKKTSV